MLRRFQLRGVVRDYCLQYLHENPGATPAQAIPAIKESLRGDFQDSPFLETLLRLVEVLLPLLLALLG